MIQKWEYIPKGQIYPCAQNTVYSVQQFQWAIQSRTLKYCGSDLTFPGPALVIFASAIAKLAAVMQSFMAIDYGSTGCGVFKQGLQNWKGFCLRINILKGNYWILRIGLVGASEVFKNQSFKSQLFSSSQ